MANKNSSKYAYSIAFEFFWSRGIKEPDAMARSATALYERGWYLREALTEVLTDFKAGKL